MRRTKLFQCFALFAVVALIVAACAADDEADEAPEDDDVAAETDEDPDDAPEDDETDEEAEADEEAEEPDEVDGPEVTLTLGHPFPDAHLVAVNAIIPMAEEIEERTNGTVTFEIVPGGGLGPPDGVYENTVAGAQDLGWALQGYTAGRFPITDIIELPYLFDSAQSATEVLWTLYEEFPEFQEEYGDVHVLGLWVHDVGDLFLSGDLATDDLSGLTLRAPGPLQNALITEMGGSAVGMGAPEMYDSLERGVIDGVMTAATALRSFDLFDVIDYMVRCDCYVAAQFLVVNQAAWDSLSADQQAIVDEVAGRNMSMWAAEAYDRIYDEVVGELGDHGIEVVELGDDERQGWHDAGDAVVEQWMADAEAAGAPAQQMHDRLLELAGQ